MEIFGTKGADTDAETILLADTFLKKLGLKTRLHINSIGCPACRAAYNKALKEYFAPHLNELCFDCKTRYEKNPLRLLDCKEESCRKINAEAPSILDYLCDDCKAHFEEVKERLTAAGVPFTVDSRIVRGLDYYTRTVFEFVADGIGAQGTVCAGGRYDGLIRNLGGGDVPAIGFAAGIERLLIVMEQSGVKIPETETLTAYIAGMDDKCRKKAFEIVTELRKNGVVAECDHMERSVKSQFKYADKSGAKYVAVIGESELEKGAATVKNMATGEAEEVSFDRIAEYFRVK